MREKNGTIGIQTWTVTFYQLYSVYILYVLLPTLTLIEKIPAQTIDPWGMARVKRKALGLYKMYLPCNIFTRWQYTCFSPIL